MPLAAKGMLLTSMDIDAADEADFNRWYDQEHLKERVEIAGFIEARRYRARSGSPKYLCLYSTRAIEVLDSAAYRERLTNPTPWSRKTTARFKNMIRVVARITVSKGAGRGTALGIVRLRPDKGCDAALREALQARLDPMGLDGVISMHLIESDARLSGPTHEGAGDAGAGDWFVLVDGTDLSAVQALLTARFGNEAPIPAMQISWGIYDLIWDIAQIDIESP